MDSNRLDRKLAAIVYADVSGYSRLSGADEEGTHRRLRTYLDAVAGLIQGHNGHVVKYAGDAVLADFSTVSDAVTCAVSIQNDLEQRNSDIPDDRKIRFRIGVNLGEVIVDRDDIYGDGVNVAARLEGLAEPGGICISGAVVDAVGTKLPLHYEFMGEQTVKHIAKPVRAYRVQTEQEQQLSTIRPRTSVKFIALVVAIVVLVAGIGGWMWLRPWEEDATSVLQTERKPALPHKPSIAVLPFSNLSGDPEQEYFSDGITNDIITDLSRFSNLFVIASNSVFTYKGTPTKVQQIGTELGVRYVLEGSVQKAGDRVRINAQLIDTQGGHHLWAERFDRQLENVFELQDDVTRNIVNALAVKLTQDEQRLLGQASQANPEAYDLLLRGLELFRRFTRETNAQAREFFKRSIAHDPSFARAYADVALTHAMDMLLGWVEPTPEVVNEALEYGKKAEALDPYVPQVHFALGSLYLSQKMREDAIIHSKRSIDLNPNYADGYAQWAQALVYSGQAQEGLKMIEQAMRLNPRYAFFYTWIEGHAYMLLGRYDEAIAAFNNVIERNAHFPGAHLTLAATYGILEQLEEAQWQAAEVLALRPDFSLAREKEVVPYKRESDRDRYIAGLRKAGLPE